MPLHVPLEFIGSRAETDAIMNSYMLHLYIKKALENDALIIKNNQSNRNEEEKNFTFNFKLGINCRGPYWEALYSNLSQ